MKYGIFWLKVIYVPQRFVFEISPCGKKVSSATEFVILSKNPPFSEISQWVQKWFARSGKFQNKFFLFYVYMISKNSSQTPFRPGKLQYVLLRVDIFFSLFKVNVFVY